MGRKDRVVPVLRVHELRAALGLRPALSPLDTAVLVLGVVAVWLLGSRFDYLLDDAFISLRYAHNLFRGFGLRFNPGETPVEGYTNFLWVLIETAHFPFTQFPEHFLVLYNKVSGVALVAIIWFQLRSRGRRVAPWLWLGVGLVAFHETVHAWMGGGLETLFYCCLLTMAIGCFLREEFESAGGIWSAFWFVLAALTRPETYLFLTLASCSMLIRSIRAQGSCRRMIIWSLGVGLPCAVHLISRRLYYGQWVPNTFVAKVPGPYFSSGACYIQLFLGSNYFSCSVALAVLGGCAVLPRLVAEQAFAREARFIAVSVLAYLFYVFYVGGDHFEFRILAPVVPLIALMLPLALASIAIRESSQRVRSVLSLAGALFGLALLGRLLWTSLTYPFAEPLGRLRVATAVGQRDANYAERWRPIGEWLSVFARNGERIAVPAAGVIPFVSDLPALDTHGLNDRVVARAPIARRGVIAHERVASWDYLVSEGVVFHIDDLEIRKSPTDFPLRMRHEPSRIIAQLLTGEWIVFGSTKDVPALRRELRARGAIIWSGPDEDGAEVQHQNALHRGSFSESAPTSPPGSPPT